ncbi:hypothetical protein ONZ45_g9088 [Pleurotus djamor]|nr:hypothetical protein ONZ45_g9088 [Pleurotus djamor]
MSSPGENQGQSTALPISQHTEHVQHRYLAYIEKHLAKQVNIPLDALPLPKKYDGTPSVDTFDTWFHTFVRWMSCHPCDGSDLDRKRLLLLSCFLEGHALAWFDHVVDGYQSRREWTFNEAIIALHDRFISWKVTHEAEEIFNSTKYDPKYGVRAFYELLSLRGAKMVHSPGQRTIVKKFLNGIPPQYIHGIMLRARGCDLFELGIANLVLYASLAEDDYTLDKELEQSGSGKRK